jgi:hypothetical protein
VVVEIFSGVDGVLVGAAVEPGWLTRDLGYLLELQLSWP